MVHAIEAHHNEVEARTVEAVLTQAADAISGGRGGPAGSRWSPTSAGWSGSSRSRARTRASRVFAMQAGREIRVMVKPDSVDDIQAQVIARESSPSRWRRCFTYPGQIRITVVRESRAMEFAR